MSLFCALSPNKGLHMTNISLARHSGSWAAALGVIDYVLRGS